MVNKAADLFKKLDRPNLNIEVQQKAKQPSGTDQQQDRKKMLRMTKINASAIRIAVEKTALEKLRKKSKFLDPD